MSFRWWLFTAISLFVIGLVFGVYSYINVPASFNAQTADLQKLSERLLEFPRPLIMAALFLKNLGAVILSIILSPVFLIVPVLTLLLNGWLIGLLSAAVIQEQSVGYLLAGLLPHGIFELTALFMGEALAFSIGTAVIRLLLGKGDFKTNVKRDLKYVLPIVILLLVAAAIEAFVTPVALKLAI